MSEIYKSPKELVEYLRSVGLIISQPFRAERLLLENSYFSVKPYFKPFLVRDVKDNIQFRENIDFEDIYLLYIFDKDFKTLILRQLIEIESKIKSAIGEVISIRYGTEESKYLRIRNFNKSNQHVRQVIKKIKDQKKIYGQKNDRLKAYSNNHNGQTPFWALANVLTMGAIRDLFNILKPNDQDYVSRIVLSFPIKKKPVAKLASIIALLTDLRNMCAHDDVVAGFQHSRVDIGYFPEHDLLKLKHNPKGFPIQGHKDLMAVLISIKYIVNKTTYKSFIQNIQSLVQKIENKLKTKVSRSILYDFLGLTTDYQNLLQYKELG